jgi:tetratricopeptide (TPR) repeat protein
MNGRFEEAVEVYERVLKHKPPKADAAQLRTEIKRLKRAPEPFKDQLPKKFRATAQAGRAFRQGMFHVRRKRLGKAVPLLRAALVLDPELPGTYRVLGGVYGKLGNPEKEREFLLDYLRIRPDGRIADAVRKKLKGTKLLSAVSLTSSFPCDIWINGRPMGVSTPVKQVWLPGGNFTISFINARYHIIRNKRTSIEPGGKAEVAFEFGVLKVDLKPWARIRATGRDLGLWDHIGLPVGEYPLSLVAHDNSKRRKMTVVIEAGKTKTLTW